MLLTDLDAMVDSLQTTLRENSVYKEELQESSSFIQAYTNHSEVSTRTSSTKTSSESKTTYNELATSESKTTSGSKPPKKPERGTLLRKSSQKEENRIISLIDPMDEANLNSKETEKVETTEMPVSLQNNLSELDTLLADLNSAKYRVDQETRTVSGSVSNSYAYGDYYSDLDSVADDKAPDRPPPPSAYEPKKKPKSKPNVPDPHLLFPPDPTSGKSKSGSEKSRAGSTSPLPSILSRKPRKPPKLMHILKEGEKRKVHDLAKENREDYFMDIDVPDEGDYGDYTNRWEYKGVSDYGSVSNYSTMKREDYDYSTLSKSPVPVLSDDELAKETGAGPRGERSKVIPTDHGEVKSKYHYLGFGLWENTDPTPRPKPKKPSPPPPPPKAEPVWYNCTVSVATTLSSKELDDLQMKDMFTDLPNREVEVGEGYGDLGAGIGEPFEMFEKEDMSDMFRRAAFEKMNLFDDDNRKKYECSVCHEGINGRIITAMARKFHPKCFVCSYCRQGFKGKKFKSDPMDGTPYCYDCFEKLLGHYGDAHEIHGI